MKIHLALSILAIALALSQIAAAQYQTPVNPVAPSATNPVIPQITGPIYEVEPQNTPPPESQGAADQSGGTVSATTQGAPAVAVDPSQRYTPMYEQTAPLYAIPPQNTPPPTTPGENP